MWDGDGLPKPFEINQPNARNTNQRPMYMSNEGIPETHPAGKISPKQAMGLMNSDHNIRGGSGLEKLGKPMENPNIKYQNQGSNQQRGLKEFLDNHTPQSNTLQINNMVERNPRVNQSQNSFGSKKNMNFDENDTITNKFSKNTGAQLEVVEQNADLQIDEY
mmetsp:Transcript_8522/g.14364  ORF Transcript_8522/g.14364 Transcript_8522/m.14364 type:complete len:162 (-) Transcript_8522:45-530(-)